MATIAQIRAAQARGQKRRNKTVSSSPRLKRSRQTIGSAFNEARLTAARSPGGNVRSASSNRGSSNNRASTSSSTTAQRNQNIDAIRNVNTPAPEPTRGTTIGGNPVLTAEERKIKALLAAQQRGVDTTEALSQQDQDVVSRFTPGGTLIGEEGTANAGVTSQSGQTGQTGDAGSNQVSPESFEDFIGSVADALAGTTTGGQGDVTGTGETGSVDGSLDVGGGIDINQIREDFLSSEEGQLLEQRRSALDDQLSTQIEQAEFAMESRQDAEKEQLRRRNIIAQLRTGQAGSGEGLVTNANLTAGIELAGAEFLADLERQGRLDLNQMIANKEMMLLDADLKTVQTMNKYISDRVSELQKQAQLNYQIAKDNRDYQFSLAKFQFDVDKFNTTQDLAERQFHRMLINDENENFYKSLGIQMDLASDLVDRYGSVANGVYADILTGLGYEVSPQDMGKTSDEKQADLDALVKFGQLDPLVAQRFALMADKEDKTLLMAASDAMFESQAAEAQQKEIDARREQLRDLDTFRQKEEIKNEFKEQPLTFENATPGQRKVLEDLSDSGLSYGDYTVVKNSYGEGMANLWLQMKLSSDLRDKKINQERANQALAFVRAVEEERGLEFIQSQPEIAGLFGGVGTQAEFNSGFFSPEILNSLLAQEAQNKADFLTGEFGNQTLSGMGEVIRLIEEGEGEKAIRVLMRISAQ